MFGRFGFGELLVILVIVLIIFGPSKLPQIGKAMGEAIGQFKKSSAEVEQAVKAGPDDAETKENS